MTRWNQARFRLERFTELGMALRIGRAVGETRGAVFWIHGLGESGLCFEQVICDPRLGEWHHVVPDLLGYGKSSWPEQALGLEQHAAGLDLLLDRLGLDSVVLVGHSMGGVIGTYLTDRRRRRVRSFVNVEGNLSPADCTFSSLVADFTVEAFLDAGYDAFLDRLYAAAASPDEIREDGSKERAAVIRAYGASLQMGDPRTLHRNSVDLVEASAAETLAERLADLAVPVEYWYGAPRGTGERSRELLAEAGVVPRAFEPAGHWPYLDRHDEFVDALAAHLASLESPRQESPHQESPRQETA